ncbi:MAG: hypothetical protein AAFU67_09725 [Bacteroidota bacterium]
MASSDHHDLLDQPLPGQPPPEKSVPTFTVVRYIITLLLFPLALLRLRSNNLDVIELLVGGLLSSLQYLLAAVVFVVLRKWWLKQASTSATLVIVLRTAVDFVVFVGLLQIGYQWWYGFGR